MHLLTNFCNCEYITETGAENAFWATCGALVSAYVLTVEKNNTSGHDRRRLQLLIIPVQRRPSRPCLIDSFLVDFAAGNVGFVS